MTRFSARFFVILYALALIGFGVVCLSLLGLLPFQLGVDGLSNMQALGVTLALMALIGLRLVMHVRAPKTPDPSEPPAS